MPWERKTVDEKRKEFVARAVMREDSFSALCREYGISRPTGYKWLERYQNGESMLDKPHAPYSRPFKTSREMETADHGCAGCPPDMGRTEDSPVYDRQG